jgi:DNA primase
VGQRLGPRFEDRDVTIVMDADRAGRLAAQRIQRDLNDVARTVATQWGHFG